MPDYDQSANFLGLNAHNLAVQRNDSHTGTEHYLLAAVTEGDPPIPGASAIRDAFDSFGITGDSLRDSIAAKKPSHETVEREYPEGILDSIDNDQIRDAMIAAKRAQPLTAEATAARVAIQTVPVTALDILASMIERTDTFASALLEVAEVDRPKLVERLRHLS